MAGDFSDPFDHCIKKPDSRRVLIQALKVAVPFFGRKWDTHFLIANKFDLGGVRYDV